MENNQSNITEEETLMNLETTYEQTQQKEKHSLKKKSQMIKDRLARKKKSE